MATIIRRFLSVFGVKTQEGPLKSYKDGVEDAAKRTQEAIDKTVEWGKAITNTVSILGGAGVAGLGALTQSMSEQVLLVDQWSQAFGVGSEKIQELGFIANSVGLELDDFGDIINTVGERAFDALADPKSEPSKLFKRMGVAIKDANGQVKPSLELLDNLADGMASVQNPTERAAIASILLGDVGVKLLPVLQQGSKGLAEMGASAHELGVVMDDSATQAVRDYTKGMFVFKSALKGVGQQLVAQLLPGLTKAAEALTKWFRTGENAKKSANALKAVLKTLAVLLAAVATAKVIAGYFALLNAIRTLVIAFKALRFQAVLAKAAVLAIPILIALIALAIEDFIGWLNGADSLTGRFIDRFKDSDGALGVMARGLDGLKPFFQDLLDLIAGFIPALLDAGKVFLKIALEMILPAVQEVGKALMVLFKEVGPPLLNLFQKIARVAISTFRKILPAVSRFISSTASLVGRLLATIVALVSANIEVIGRFIAAIIPLVTKVLGWVIAAIDAMTPFIEKFLQENLEGILAFITSMVQGFEKFVAMAWPMVQAFIGGLKQAIDGILPVVVGIAGGIVSVIETIWSWGQTLWNGFISAWQSMVGFFGGIGQAILGVFGKIINKILGFFKPLFKTMQKAIDVANKFGADIDVNLNSALKNLQKKVSNATDFSAEISAASSAAASQVSNARNTNVGQVNVNIQGSPQQTLSGQDISNAARQGLVDASSLRAAERDFASG